MLIKKSRKSKKKQKKVMLYFIIIIAIITLITSITIINNPKTKITNTINKTFNALKIGDIEKSKKYIDYDKLISILDNEILNEENLQKHDLNKILFKELKWKIQNIEIKENKVTLEVETTNKDYSQIVMKFLENIIQKEKNKETITEDVYIETLKEAILNTEIETFTQLKKITLKKSKGNLQIVVNDELGSALFPKIENLDKILSEIQ